MSQASLLFRSSSEPVDRSSPPPIKTRRSSHASSRIIVVIICYRSSPCSTQQPQRDSSPRKLDRADGASRGIILPNDCRIRNQSDSGVEHVSVVPTVEGQPVAPTLELAMPVVLDPAMMGLLTPAVGPQPEAVNPMVALSLGMNRHPATAQAMAGHANNLPDLIASLPATKVTAEVQATPETLVQQDWLIHIGEPLPAQVEIP